MKILLIITIIVFIIFIGLYAFWQKLLKGKPGRISGEDTEKKTFEEALIVDVRWRKEYERTHAVNAINVPIKLLKEKSKILKPYKDKDIILYCTVDVTSRNAEKLLRERGFTKLHIADGVKQYNYSKVTHKNILLSELKYMMNSKLKFTLLNIGDENLLPEEITTSLDSINDIEEKISKNNITVVYSSDASKSLQASILLGKKGYNILNLIEPFEYSKYVLTTYNKKDYIIDSKEPENVEDCG